MASYQLCTSVPDVPDVNEGRCLSLLANVVCVHLNTFLIAVDLLPEKKSKEFYK